MKRDSRVPGWWPIRREVIGNPDCPILYRWTLLGEPTWPGRWPFKLMVHRFLPLADDRHVHDHPRPFWTFVVRGGYDDLNPCPECWDSIVPGAHVSLEFLPGRDEITTKSLCSTCHPQDTPDGLVVGDRMRAGTIRHRPAEHRHRTRVLPSGAWTIVVMGPLQRRWGFWKDGGWMFWEDYEALHGFAMRCEGNPDSRPREFSE